MNTKNLSPEDHSPRQWCNIIPEMSGPPARLPKVDL